MLLKNKSIAILLLAVFTVGGLLSPLAHRISHVHSLEHQHGQAAAHFSAHRALSGNSEFYVEERTPPHERVCDLCARLTLTALSTGETSSHRAEPSSVFGLPDEYQVGHSQFFSRIRAPPVMA